MIAIHYLEYTFVYAHLYLTNAYTVVTIRIVLNSTVFLDFYIKRYEFKIVKLPTAILRVTTVEGSIYLFLLFSFTKHTYFSVIKVKGGPKQ